MTQIDKIYIPKETLRNQRIRHVRRKSEKFSRDITNMQGLMKKYIENEISMLPQQEIFLDKRKTNISNEKKYTNVNPEEIIIKNILVIPQLDTNKIED